MDVNRPITINVPVLARVEGEGALDLDIRDGAIRELRLRIFEPPRYFEKFLEGRSHHEIPDIVARICGICPVAYQMSAAQAIEQAFGHAAGPWVREMRRLMYCGEWIQSHALHVHLLAVPDFLGFGSAIEMARDFPEEVKRGLHLQGLGNRLIRFLGGRSVHPVGIRPGGFHHAPPYAEADALLQALRAALVDAENLVRWTASLDFPDDCQDFINVALHHPDEYGIYAGRIITDTGLSLAAEDYETHFREAHVPHSTALYSYVDDQPYLTGPLARVNLNREQLAQALPLLDELPVQFPSRNMFHSIVARAVEIHYALLEAIRLLEGYSRPDQPFEEITPRAGTGFGVTEAPRGILWHRYDFAADGTVKTARIVPPTAQNQARIEDDLHQSIQAFGLNHSDDAIRLRAETVIRNYDPCISCATHFLRVNVRRDGA
jgi:coenzyme F420-reducing hydrogenase alpha subunit